MTTMSPLRRRMIEDMTTARYARVATGLIAGTASPFDQLTLEVIPPE